MGTCCSKETYYGDGVTDATEEKEEDDFGEDNVDIGDYGARVRLRGASKFISMYTQQGRKGINQDAMTVWEEFTGIKDMFFCGVFDGHGPYGHKVSRHVRDNLPSRLSTVIKSSQQKSFRHRDIDHLDTGIGNGDGSGVDDTNNKDGNNSDNDNKENDSRILLLSSWETSFIKSFKEMDDELSLDASIDSFCSGSTAVTVVKKGNHLLIANLGDSRALLCTRGSQNQLFPVQLTVDLKPNIASEAERIKNCNGRIFAMEQEPEVFRIWMPDDDCPGLAMARAFGDFCLKNHGLISIPEVSYRRLTNKDEFVVLATDGVWDVLTNHEVIKIVASAKKRSMAAKLLVKHAVRAWKSKYPGCKVDDCAVICLFLKSRTLRTRSFSEVTQLRVNNSELDNYSDISGASLNHTEIAAVTRKHKSSKSEGIPENAKTSQGSLENSGSPVRTKRSKSSARFPRVLRNISSRKRSTNNAEAAGASR